MLPPLLNCVQIALPTLSITQSDQSKLKAWLRQDHRNNEVSLTKQLALPLTSVSWVYDTFHPTEKALSRPEPQELMFSGAKEEPLGPLEQSAKLVSHRSLTMRNNVGQRHRWMWYNSARDQSCVHWSRAIAGNNKLLQLVKRLARKE